jgi:general secretion pathway protein E
LHTNDAPSAITRLLDIGVPPYLINSTLLGVMGQRLVRTLCPHCRKPAAVEGNDETSWTHLVAPFKSAAPAHIYQPLGCLECRNTGYRGRMGIYETLLMSASIRQHVMAGADLALIRQTAYREGMKPLRISGAMKVAKGLTTLEEVIKVAPPASDDAAG